MNVFLRNPGSAAGAVMLLAVMCALPALALEVETSLQPQRVRVGSTAVLSVKISGAGSPESVRIPAVDGLEISFSGTQKSFEFINGRSWSGLVLTYSIVPTRSGTYTIPPIVLNTGGKTLRSQPVQLAAYEGAAVPGGSGVIFKADVFFTKKRVYEGEPVLVRYYLLHSGMDLRSRPVFEKIPGAKGALLKQIDEALPEENVLSVGGGYLKTHIATFAVIPAEKGSITVGEGSLVISTIDSSGFFSFPRNRRIECPGGILQVDPIPVAGKPADYRGDVGNFVLSTSYTADAVKIFDEKKIILTVKGRGNLLSISTPSIAKIDGLKIISEVKAEKLKVTGNSLEGEKEFVFTFIPEKAGIVSQSGFTLSFFNPESGRYETARSADIRFTAKEDPSRRAGIELEGEGKGDSVIEINFFIITGIFLAAAGIIVLVIIWEQKKRKMAVKIQAAGTGVPEKSPPEDLKEKLLRDMRAALRRADAGKFLHTAEKMMMLLREETRSGKNAGCETEVRLHGIKEKLYLNKYGAGVVTPAFLDEMYALIKSVHDELKDFNRTTQS